MLWMVSTVELVVEELSLKQSAPACRHYLVQCASMVAMNSVDSTCPYVVTAVHPTLHVTVTSTPFTMVRWGWLGEYDAH